MEIAITGAGCVSPVGTTAAELIEGWREGALGVRPSPWSAAAPGPTLFAAVDARFDPTTVADARLIDGTDPFAAFALAASAEALRTAGLDGPEALDPLRTAVIDGTSMGGWYSLMAAQRSFEVGGSEAIPPKAMLKVWSNMAAAQIAIRYGLHGPQHTITTACASALDALGHATMLLTTGLADVVLSGGTEGGVPRGAADGFVPVTSVAGRILGMESPVEDPSRAVLPFDVERSGIVFGEGAGWFVLESAAHARARGARPLAWLAGYGTCSEAHHPSSPDPTGRWEAHAMGLAHASAGLDASEVDVVIAHATGTPKGDLAEIRALDQVFLSSGARRDVVVTALKGTTGHTGASSGAMSTVGALAMLADQRVEPIGGTSLLDPEVHFDAVLHEPRTMPVEVVQINAFGFGGQDASIVLRRDS